MNVERGTGVPDPVWQRAVQLARALCTDAHLYGGQPGHYAAGMKPPLASAPAVTATYDCASF